jgi:hypothetical protein
MELIKQQPSLEFAYKDVTFIIKSTVTAGDKLQLDMAGEYNGKGQFEFSPNKYYRLLAEIFVTGWRGVQQDGKEVAYSFKTLCDSFPCDPAAGDVFLLLGAFINEKLGLKGESKNA